MISEKEVRNKIEIYLREYDCVFVVDKRIFLNKRILERLPLNIEKRVLLLMEEVDENLVSICKTDIKTISAEEYDYIEKLYRMYEFSGHIYFLSDGNQYGSLRNYVLNGLLTEEEMFAALFS